MRTIMAKFIKCHNICWDLIYWFNSANDIIIDRMAEDEDYFYVWYHIKEDNE